MKSDALPSFYASGKIIGEILKREGQIDALPPIEGTYDASFVRALQGRLRWLSARDAWRNGLAIGYTLAAWSGGPMDAHASGRARSTHWASAGGACADLFGLSDS